MKSIKACGMTKLTLNFGGDVASPSLKMMWCSGPPELILEELIVVKTK